MNVSVSAVSVRASADVRVVVGSRALLAPHPISVAAPISKSRRSEHENRKRIAGILAFRGRSGPWSRGDPPSLPSCAILRTVMLAKDQTLTVLGCGTMGEAIVRGILRSGR